MLIFEKKILLANTSIKMGLKKNFFSFSNINIQFAKKTLIQRFYIIKKSLPFDEQVEFINKKKFAKAAINKIFKIFKIYIIALKTSKITIFF